MSGGKTKVEGDIHVLTCLSGPYIPVAAAKGQNSNLCNCVTSNEVNILGFRI
jgi:hypothetical protein